LFQRLDQLADCLYVLVVGKHLCKESNKVTVWQNVPLQTSRALNTTRQCRKQPL
jgi:hypothetical protein